MTDETDLIQRAGRFEQAALAEIYDHYSLGVFRYAVRLLGDANLAEDCVADTITRYLQALRGGGGPQEDLDQRRLEPGLSVDRRGSGSGRGNRLEPLMHRRQGGLVVRHDGAYRPTSETVARNRGEVRSIGRT